MAKRGGEDADQGRLTLKLTPKAKRMLMEVADARGMTVSDLVQMVLDEGFLVEAILENNVPLEFEAPNGARYRIIKDGKDQKFIAVDETGQYQWNPQITE